MTEEYVISLGRQALLTVLLVSAPMLGFGLLVGVVVSIFQATTQINEQTLAFIPKIIAVLVALVIFGPWMITVMLQFTSSLWLNLPQVIR
ncbi:MAG: flagellar biosynthesis protein FliQ [Firmicutes bacterium]|nr:flagellar biosynthesis protein FliQ [Bacillota bacterium]